MTATTRAPATPLPWKQAHGHFQHVTGDDIAYIVTACNAYPELVAALRFCIGACDDSMAGQNARVLLRKLGEST